MKSKIKKSLRFFTLIELIAAMGVFTVIMLILLTFFDGAQRAWTNCINRSQIYENARVAMDLIARDLQCAYYEVDKVPFWNKGYTNYGGTSAVYDQQMLAFVSVTSIPPNDNCDSKICEVKYQLYNYESTFPGADPKKEGWLMRSATGDKTDANADNVYSTTNATGKLNYYNNFTVSENGAPTAVTNVFTATSSSSDDYQKVIPYVTKLEFTCYNRQGTEIPADAIGNGSGSYTMTFPYSVRIELTLLDQVSWNKWKALRGKRYSNTLKVLTDSGNSTAEDIRNRSERTFVKTVVLGERGQ
ncbi:MAG TPA: hypothetical protein DCZ94_00490 [Lentisphaeria bacterium]|nr:MAG: hypothetical protein A2X48_12050 [Lentisphaerae bacterium GWF2_49_21]HBC85409.1 hypothetical protein [Lentisphaeria bacterium]